MEHIISSYLCIIWPTAANLHTLPPTLPPYVYPFFNSVSGRGSVFTAEERRQCIAIVYDDILWNALLVESASKHYGSVHTFRRSTSLVRLVGVVGEFPDTCVATELMHGLRRKFP